MVELWPSRMSEARAQVLSLGLRKRMTGAGEMAQWLRALIALPEVLSSNPSNHSHLQWNPMPSSGVFEDSYSVLRWG